MDQRVVQALKDEGIDPSLEDGLPSIGVEIDDDGRPRPAGASILVTQGKKTVTVELAPISALLTGARQPPSFKTGPTPEYVHFFLMIESTALDFCLATKRFEYDEEVARLYNLLRRRPDGSDPNPLFSYLQAAVRLYLSLRDGSPAEFEAVLNRLTRSAKRFSENAASTHLMRTLAEQLQRG